MKSAVARGRHAREKPLPFPAEQPDYKIPTVSSLAALCGLTGITNVARSRFCTRRGPLHVLSSRSHVRASRISGQKPGWAESGRDGAGH